MYSNLNTYKLIIIFESTALFYTVKLVQMNNKSKIVMR